MSDRVMRAARRAVLAGAALLAPAAGASAQYAVQTVTFPTDPTFTQLLGVNNAGTIVGYHGATVNKGFTLTLPNHFTDTNFPGSSQTQVVGIAGNGARVGFYVDAAGVTHGFVNLAGGPLFGTVDKPGTAFNQVLGVSNDAAHIAGYSSTDPTGATLQRAYVGSAGLFGNTFTDINGLLPSNVNSQATGINDAGTAVGFYLPTATTSSGFLLTGSTVSFLNVPGSTFTQALGINDRGEIVGFYQDAGGVQHGFTDLGGRFASFDPAGSAGTVINGVNDEGQIVGFYVDGAGNTVGFVGSVVPEPSTWALLGTGLAGLAGVAVRRRRVPTIRPPG